MIFELIYQTVIIVLLLSFSFGPAFFALINAGIKHGYKTASLFAVGVVASDFIVALLVILLIHFGASNLIQDEESQRFMGILAGIILIVFGAITLSKPSPKIEDETTEMEVPSKFEMVVRGFLLNCFNPAVWLLWLGNVTIISNSFNYSFWKMMLFFSVVLSLVLLVELGKVSVAGKLKRVLTPKTMHIVNMITGILLVIFGLVLIYEHYFKTKLL